jgi:hypothetical protein
MEMGRPFRIFPGKCYLSAGRMDAGMTLKIDWVGALLAFCALAAIPLISDSTYIIGVMTVALATASGQRAGTSCRA